MRSKSTKKSQIVREVFMSGRKVTFDTEKAIKLLKKGIKQKDIATKLNIKESTLKMFFKRKAGDELKGIKEQKKQILLMNFN